jgi:hypothetical protein
VLSNSEKEESPDAEAFLGSMVGIALLFGFIDAAWWVAGVLFGWPEFSIEKAVAFIILGAIIGAGVGLFVTLKGDT